MTITFDELRRIKDSLPDGSMARIADELSLPIETVRNYFGGYNFRTGTPSGVHFEKGPGGGIVHIDDPRILEVAQRLLEQEPAHSA